LDKGELLDELRDINDRGDATELVTLGLSNTSLSQEEFWLNDGE
jgi:hypothetical protein